MSVSSKIRWKRSLNQLRFIHEEQELVREIVSVSGPEFQKYYLEHCAENGIDLETRNKENEEHIRGLYSEEAGEAEDVADINPEDGSLILHDGREFDDGGDQQMTQDEREMYEEFTKLYKKLVTICHPDTLSIYLTEEERDDKISMFLAISKAIREKQYYTILEYAEKHKIPLPRNHKQQTRWMKKEFDRIRTLVENEKQTYNYLFSECETKEDKERLVKQFINQIFKS